MHWLQELDLALLRFINQTLSNPFFDVLMPFASGNAFFFPVVVIAGLLMLWKGGKRARLCLLMIALIVGPGDGLIVNTIKKGIARPRPYVTHDDIRRPGTRQPAELKSEEDRRLDAPATPPVRKGGFNSMPSAHAANWAATTMIFFVFYRRSLWIVLPIALTVTLSRVYNGVHYPSDVLAGFILGSGYAVAGMWLFNALWQIIGRRWFPLWSQHVPSLTNPGAQVPEQSANGDRQSTVDSHWVRLGYSLIGILLLTRLWYIGSGEIELSGDEAYQWIWSKHLALSYYSKPLMIALTQWLGTNLWGDTEFGVRFFSPILAAIVSTLLLRFFARYVSGRAAFMLLLISSVTPLLVLGSVVMTIDPLSVFFWTLAMIAGWKAVQPESHTSDWAWVGLWMGLGFLSKYTALFQLLCWAVFFAIWPAARAHLRRPGPYVALLVNALCTLPVIIWNAQNNWITVTHVQDNAGVGSQWKWQTGEFLGVEAALLNPIFFIALLWAAVAWRRTLKQSALANYLFSMGTPLFLCYFLWSFRSRILPNWIAPSVLPMFCLMVLYWNARWPDVRRWAKPLLVFGFALGTVTTVLMHDTDLIAKIVGRPLPPKPDPMTRLRGYRESGRLVETHRQELLAEGKPTFIICAHYQHTGLLTFYIPEARTNVTGTALIYAQRSDTPKNQFYFWPSYKEQRRGQNALYVREVAGPPLVDGWIGKWLSGETNLLRHPHKAAPIPKQLLEDFESVTDLGLFHARYKGRIFHTYQILECRHLK